MKVRLATQEDLPGVLKMLFQDQPGPHAPKRPEAANRMSQVQPVEPSVR